MKWAIFLSVAVLLGTPIYSETSAEKGHVTLSIGSLRAPYPIFISESEVATPLVEIGIPVGFSARFRAWSVPYFFNYRSMDLHVIVRAPIALSQNFSLSPLLGYEIGLRNPSDVRADPNVKTWYVPTLGAMLTGRIDWFESRAQLESLFYANGISLRAIPEIGVRFESFSILAKAEFTYLIAHNSPDREFHAETFIAFRLEY